MSEPFVHTLRVRYNECDAQGVVFNANHFTYFDITITELWRAAFGSYDAMIETGYDLMVAHAEADFSGPVRFDDELSIEARITRMGTSSITTELTERVDGRSPVTGKLVHVFVDAKTYAKTDIPADARKRLAPWTTS